MKKYCIILLLSIFESMAQVKVSDFDFKNISQNPSMTYLGQNQTCFFFTVQVPANYTEVWLSDGTPEGTKKADYQTDTYFPFSAFYNISFNVNDEGLFFTSNRKIIKVQNDGKVKEIAAPLDNEFRPTKLTLIDDEIYAVFEKFEEDAYNEKILKINVQDALVMFVDDPINVLSSGQNLLYTQRDKVSAEYSLFHNFKKVYSSQQILTFNSIEFLFNSMSEKMIIEQNEIHFPLFEGDSKVASTKHAKITTQGKFIQFDIPWIKQNSDGSLRGQFTPLVVSEKGEKFLMGIRNNGSGDSLLIYKDLGEQAIMFKKVKIDYYLDIPSGNIGFKKLAKLENNKLSFYRVYDSGGGRYFTTAIVDFSKENCVFNASAGTDLIDNIHTTFPSDLFEEVGEGYRYKTPNFDLNFKLGKSETININYKVKPTASTKFSFQGSEIEIGSFLKKLDGSKTIQLLDNEEFINPVLSIEVNSQTFKNQKVILLNKTLQGQHETWRLVNNKMELIEKGEGFVSFGIHNPQDPDSYILINQKLKTVNFEKIVDLTLLSVKGLDVKPFKTINQVLTYNPRQDAINQQVMAFRTKDSIHVISGLNEVKSFRFNSKDEFHIVGKNIYILDKSRNDFSLKNLVNNKIIFEGKGGFSVYNTTQNLFIFNDKKLLKINSKGDQDKISGSAKDFSSLKNIIYLKEELAGVFERIMLIDPDSYKVLRSFTKLKNDRNVSTYYDSNKILIHDQKEQKLILMSKKDELTFDYPPNVQSFESFDEVLNTFSFVSSDKTLVLFEILPNSNQLKQIIKTNSEPYQLRKFETKSFKLYSNPQTGETIVLKRDDKTVQTLELGKDEKLSDERYTYDKTDFIQIFDSKFLKIVGYFTEENGKIIRKNGSINEINGIPFEIAQIQDILTVRHEFLPEKGNELVAYTSNQKIIFPEIIKGSKGVYFRDYFVHEGRFYAGVFSPFDGYQIWQLKGASDKEDAQVLSNEEQVEKDLLLFPNPATDVLNVKSSSGGQFQIMNSMGQIQLEGSISNQAEVNINNLKSGVYIFKLKNNTDSKIKRFVKF